VSQQHRIAVDTSGDLREKGLAANALGLKESVVIGLASTAPAYSLAATLGYLILEVGEFSAASILLAFVPMLFIAFAYRELNRAAPDSGTTFTWGAKAFGPWVGWMGGWAVALSGTIFLANAAEVAAYYLLTALGEMGVPLAGDLAGNKWATLTLGVASIALMTWVSYRGIQISSRVQNVLIVLQYGALALFAGALLIPVLNGTAPEGGTSLSLSQLNPFAIDSTAAMLAAVVIGVFLFWGWESTVSINEETKDPDKTPGRAAVISTLVILATYVSVTMAVVSFGGTGGGLLDFSDAAVAEGSADDVFSPPAAAIGLWLAIVIQLAIVISAVSSTQTTILPTTRGFLAMGVYKALPRRFAEVHPRYLSPSYATVVMGVAAIIYYIGMTLISQNILYDSIASIGLAITFYYALTGYSSVWYFRRDLTDSARDFFFKGLLPLLGAIILTWVFAQSLLSLSDPVNNYSVLPGPLSGIGAAFLLGVGGLLLGAVFMVWLATRSFNKPFFGGETLTRDTPVLVPEDEHALVVSHEVPVGEHIDPDQVENVLDVLEEQVHPGHAHPHHPKDE
jgi:amino acid transporter